MKKIVYGIVGLTLLASVSFAKDVEFYVKRNEDIVQVSNKEGLDKNYKGDTFFNYRKEKGKWILDHITYAGNGVFIRNFVCEVDEEEVPAYMEGMYSLYYDKDQGEESLVAIFDESVDSKVKEAWIELAKKHIRELYLEED